MDTLLRAIADFAAVAQEPVALDSVWGHLKSLHLNCGLDVDDGRVRDAVCAALGNLALADGVAVFVTAGDGLQQIAVDNLSSFANWETVRLGGTVQSLAATVGSDPTTLENMPALQLAVLKEIARAGAVGVKQTTLAGVLSTAGGGKTRDGSKEGSAAAKGVHYVLRQLKRLGLIVESLDTTNIWRLQRYASRPVSRWDHLYAFLDDKDNQDEDGFVWGSLLRHEMLGFDSSLALTDALRKLKADGKLEVEEKEKLLRFRLVRSADEESAQPTIADGEHDVAASYVVDEPFLQQLYALIEAAENGIDLGSLTARLKGASEKHVAKLVETLVKEYGVISEVVMRNRRRMGVLKVPRNANYKSTPAIEDGPAPADKGKAPETAANADRTEDDPSARARARKMTDVEINYCAFIRDYMEKKDGMAWFHDLVKALHTQFPVDQNAGSVDRKKVRALVSEMGFGFHKPTNILLPKANLSIVHVAGIAAERLAAFARTISFESNSKATGADGDRKRQRPMITNAAMAAASTRKTGLEKIKEGKYAIASSVHMHLWERVAAAVKDAQATASANVSAIRRRATEVLLDDMWENMPVHQYRDVFGTPRSIEPKLLEADIQDVRAGALSGHVLTVVRESARKKLRRPIEVLRDLGLLEVKGDALKTYRLRSSWDDGEATPRVRVFTALNLLVASASREETETRTTFKDKPPPPHEDYTADLTKRLSRAKFWAILENVARSYMIFGPSRHHHWRITTTENEVSALGTVFSSIQRKPEFKRLNGTFAAMPDDWFHHLADHAGVPLERAVQFVFNKDLFIYCLKEACKASGMRQSNKRQKIEAGEKEAGETEKKKEPRRDFGVPVLVPRVCVDDDVWTSRMDDIVRALYAVGQPNVAFAVLQHWGAAWVSNMKVSERVRVLDREQFAMSEIEAFRAAAVAVRACHADVDNMLRSDAPIGDIEKVVEMVIKQRREFGLVRSPRELMEIAPSSERKPVGKIPLPPACLGVPSMRDELAMVLWSKKAAEEGLRDEDGALVTHNSGLAEKMLLRHGYRLAEVADALVLDGVIKKRKTKAPPPAAQPSASGSPKQKRKRRRTKPEVDPEFIHIGKNFHLSARLIDELKFPYRAEILRAADEPFEETMLVVVSPRATALDVVPVLEGLALGTMSPIAKGSQWVRDASIRLVDVPTLPAVNADLREQITARLNRKESKGESAASIASALGVRVGDVESTLASMDNVVCVGAKEAKYVVRGREWRWSTEVAKPDGGYVVPAPWLLPDGSVNEYARGQFVRFVVPSVMAKPGIAEEEVVQSLAVFMSARCAQQLLRDLVFQDKLLYTRRVAKLPACSLFSEVDDCIPALTFDDQAAGNGFVRALHGAFSDDTDSTVSYYAVPDALSMIQAAFPLTRKTKKPATAGDPIHRLRKTSEDIVNGVTAIE